MPNSIFRFRRWIRIWMGVWLWLWLWLWIRFVGIWVWWLDRRRWLERWRGLKSASASASTKIIEKLKRDLSVNDIIFYCLVDRISVHSVMIKTFTVIWPSINLNFYLWLPQNKFSCNDVTILTSLPSFLQSRGFVPEVKFHFQFTGEEKSISRKSLSLFLLRPHCVDSNLVHRFSLTP